jgi:hypothetical protein
MGALAFYEHFLTIDDEVCQSYPLSDFQRYSKLVQRYLTSGGEGKIGVGTPDPRCCGPSLTLHVAPTSILPVLCGTIITGLSSGTYLNAQPQNRYLLLSFAVSTEICWWSFSTTPSQTHNFNFSDSYSRKPCWCPHFSLRPGVLIPTSGDSVRICSVSCTTPHDERQL